MSEFNNFKEEIKAILFALGKICSENNLKKMYREQTGHSINQKLQEVNKNPAFSLGIKFQKTLNFLL